MLKRILSKDFIMGILLTSIFILLPHSKIEGVQKFLSRLDGIAYDVRLLATLPTEQRKTDVNVVIVDIDEKSMMEQGRFPWTRTKVAELVDKLMAAGVAVTAFDIFFAESEPNPLVELNVRVPQIEGYFGDEMATLVRDVDADLSFSQALEQSESVLGFLLHNDALLTVGQLPPSVINWTIPDNTQAYVRSYEAAVANISILQNSAIGGGFINAVGDPDGFIRRAALVAQYNGELYPSLALEAARIYTLVDAIETQTFEQDELQLFQAIKIKDQWIETDEYGQVLIAYKGKQRSFPYYSATDILHGRIGAEELAGAVVFIGTSATGLADLRATPVGNQYPGVEVHANVFESLIHPEFMPFEPNETVAINFLMTLITGLLLAIFLPKRGATTILAIALGFILFHIGFNWYLWTEYRVSLAYFIQLALVVLLSIYFSTTAFFVESKNKKQMKEMFGQYVPPAYVEKLLVSGKVLTPERREMTVLFNDIRNFTSISEKFTPEQLSEFLNIYLSQATEIIFNNNGTVDKYVGDMVMAFWNAPLDDENHAQNAVLTALLMQQTAENLSIEYANRDWPDIKTGTGISTGQMNVGDMGSKHRSSYTVLGDAVNLGARLEGLTKYYGVGIIVAETTYEACNGILFRFLDKVTVVGKDMAVSIYEPICLKNEASSIHSNNLDKHNAAYRAYYEQQWDEATKLFLALKSQKVFSTKVYDIFLANIEKYRQLELPENWDGVTKHARK